MAESTATKSRIFVEDLNLATGGTGVAETGIRRTSVGGEVTMTKIDASHIKYRNVSTSLENSATSAYLCLTEAEITAAITAIGSDDGLIKLIEAISLTDDLTIPANIILDQEPVAVLTIPTTKTLTINGILEPSLYQKFSCTGTGNVVIGQQSADVVHPVWWYSGSGSWSAAIQAAINCRAPSVPNTVQITGAISCVTGVTIADDNVAIQGPGGQNSAVVTFAPTTTATLFTWSNGASMVSKCGIRDIELVGSGTEIKTFLNAIDADVFTINNVQVYDDSAVANIGLYAQGRDHWRVEKFTVTCQRPIVIGGNPNSTIDLDNSVFRELYLVCTLSTGKNIDILTGVNLTNVYFEPPISCNTGAYGLYWVDTTTTQASLNIGIRGLRAEQPRADGWTIRIEHNYALYNLILDGIEGGMQNGYYLRKVQGEMRACRYIGVEAVTGNPYTAGVALDLDSVVGDFLITNSVNVNAQGGTGGLTIGSGAKLAFRMGRNANSYAYIPGTVELYTTDTAFASGTGARTVQAHSGVQTWSWRGTVADDEVITLPILSATAQAGRIWATAYCAGVGNKMIDCLIAFGYPILLTNSTADTDDADTDGSLCLIYGANMTLRNRLGASAEITIHAEWSITGE